MSYKLGGRVETSFGLGKIVVEFYDSNIVRIVHLPPGAVLNESFAVIAKPAPIPITIDYREHEVVVSSDETSVRINKVSNVIEISFGDLVIREISRSAVKQRRYGIEFYRKYYQVLRG